MPGLKEDIHLHCAINGLDSSSQLKKSIMKCRPLMLIDFQDRSKQYLELEQMEMKSNTAKDRSPLVKDREKPSRLLKGKEEFNSHRRNFSGRVSNNRHRGDKSGPVAKYADYTPLNVSPAQVWKEVAQTEMKKVERPTSAYS